MMLSNDSAALQSITQDLQTRQPGVIPSQRSERPLEPCTTAAIETRHGGLKVCPVLLSTVGLVKQHHFRSKEGQAVGRPEERPVEGKGDGLVPAEHEE